jgi:hypothetical protein
MCCITMLMQDVTMATTQLMLATSYETRWTRPEEPRTELRTPRMNWVVVTDEHHNLRMQMRWAPSAAGR